MKIVAMVPARMGSKRVKNKNLRLINGKPLIDYVLDTIESVDLFDAVYINSESDVFQQLADKHGFHYYKRPKHLSSDTATNDEFAADFLANIKCDLLIQILPTSPFLEAAGIRAFVEMMRKESLDTLVSVEHKQIACLYEGRALNYDPLRKNPPSQTMAPVMAYATALMGWRKEKFLENFENFGVGYHGGEGNTGYFELRGLSTVDIDREEDFRLAESIILANEYMTEAGPSYFEPESAGASRSEVDVPSILAKDGVVHNDLFDVNNEIVDLDSILQEMPRDVSWSKRLVDTESNSMTIISQMPGEGNRLHYHPDWNEWWYILEGEWEWLIEGQTKRIKKGDVVFMRKNRRHRITAAGDSRAVRMAVSRADVAHIYDE